MHVVDASFRYYFFEAWAESLVSRFDMMDHIGGPITPINYALGRASKLFKKSYHTQNTSHRKRG